MKIKFVKMRWQFILIGLFFISVLILTSGCFQEAAEPAARDTVGSMQKNLTCPYDCCSADEAWDEKKCFYEKQSCRNHRCKWTTPIDVLNDKLIFSLDILCEGLDKARVSDCILEWQEKNMFSCLKDREATTKAQRFFPGYMDCSEPLQLNEMLVGSFPASKILEKRKEGKTYGTSFEFAVAYCALARLYGVTCRVAASKSKLSRVEESSDYGPGACGIVRKSLLMQIDESCEEWQSLAWEPGPEHYWAEVWLDNQWVVKEAKQIEYSGGSENAFKLTGNYYDTGW